MGCLECERFRCGVASAAHFARHQELDKRRPWLCSHCQFQAFSTQDAILHVLLQGHFPPLLHNTSISNSTPISADDKTTMSIISSLEDSYANDKSETLSSETADSETDNCYRQQSCPSPELDEDPKHRNRLGTAGGFYIKPIKKTNTLDMDQLVSDSVSEFDSLEAARDFEGADLMDSFHDASFSLNHTAPLLRATDESTLANSVQHSTKKMLPTSRKDKTKKSAKSRPASFKKPNHTTSFADRNVKVTLQCRKCSKYLKPKQKQLKQIVVQHATGCFRLKPFACNFCDLRFRQKAHFYMHVRMGMGKCDGAKIVMLDKEGDEKKAKEALLHCFPEQSATWSRLLVE